MFCYMPEICNKGAGSNTKTLEGKQRKDTQVGIYYSVEEERVVRNTLKSHQSQVKQFDGRNN